jgi:hypothetical protein
MVGPFSVMQKGVGFPFCANETLLPLTVRKASASMSKQLGKMFSHLAERETHT